MNATREYEIAADPSTLVILRELEEWPALGFYEGLDHPWPRAYGLAFRRMYENMAIRVPDNGLILPHEPLPASRTMASHGAHHAMGFIMNPHHSEGFVVESDMVQEKKHRFPHHATFIDRLASDLKRRLQGNGGGYTHSNPDIRRVVSEGFDAMEAELDAELAAMRDEGRGADPAESSLLLALKDYACGVRAFHRRTADALWRDAGRASGTRHEELRLVASEFECGFVKPAGTFLQGLLAVNFTWLLDGCDSTGRVDQALGALFERDITSGTLDTKFARRLLDEWWGRFEDLNGWNLQIGGHTPEGTDGCNKLTHEILLACRRNKLRRPNVAFRVTRETPDALLLEAFRSLSTGTGRPALYNDDLYIETLRGMDLGLSPEDAREISFGGCTETMIGGMSNVGSLDGEINLAIALERALYDGKDPGTGIPAGPATGLFEDCPDFEVLLEAVKTQIACLIDAFVERRNRSLRARFERGDPKLYRTFFTRDCVRNRRSFEAGGARYNWSVVTFQGLAHVIDALAAVRTLVFQSKRIGKHQLMEALRRDFQGFEALRQRLVRAPKFGNDIPEIDDLGREIAAFAWERLYANPTPRGGRYLPSCIVFATYDRAGKAVGALPDGRRAGMPLNDSVGAATGRDVSGPTALLNSVTRLPLRLAAGTPVLNLRFPASLFRSPREMRALLALVRGYFRQGGMQAQISVVSREDMLAARKRPEAYQDLIVRVGGYSEYFTRLSRALQDSVIARTEHTLW